MNELGRMKVGVLTGWPLEKIIEVHDRVREEVAARLVEIHLAIDASMPDRQFEQACVDAIDAAFDWFMPPYLEPLYETDPTRAMELAAYGMILVSDAQRLYERVVELLTVSTHPNSGRVMAFVVNRSRERFEA
jgi:hypothetical protein